MCEHNITFRQCRTLEDAIAIRNSYHRNDCGCDINTLLVDMSRLDRKEPDVLLLGVLLNMRHFFEQHVEIRLLNYPDYLPMILKICRREELFTLCERAP